MRTITLIEAIREAYQEELRRDEDVFLVGQDIRGAIFPHTKGLVCLLYTSDAADEVSPV